MLLMQMLLSRLMALGSFYLCWNDRTTRNRETNTTPPEADLTKAGIQSKCGIEKIQWLHLLLTPPLSSPGGRSHLGAVPTCRQQQLTIILPDCRPIRTELPWLQAQARWRAQTRTSHLPTASAYSRHGEKESERGMDGARRRGKNLSAGRMRLDSRLGGEVSGSDEARVRIGVSDSCAAQIPTWKCGFTPLQLLLLKQTEKKWQ